MKGRLNCKRSTFLITSSSATEAAIIATRNVYLIKVTILHDRLTWITSLSTHEKKFNDLKMVKTVN